MKPIIALGQINSTVGALDANARLISEYAKTAAEQGASIIVFPELALSGYPPEDLVLKEHFIAHCWEQLRRLASELPAECIVLVGAPQSVDQRVYNAAVAYHGGHIVATYEKMVLPNYGVFDEKRVFAPGRMPLILQAGPMRIGIHVCEDSWYPDQEAGFLLKDTGLDLLVNLSASPYHRGKRLLREEVLRRTGQHLDCPLAYCNMVGGQDELVFDGGSLVMDREGSLLSRGPQFDADLILTEVPVAERGPRVEEPDPPIRRIVHLPFQPNPRRRRTTGTSSIAPLLEDHAEVYAALKTGLRDYLEKNGFRKTVVALSGGIDSALVAAIAVDTLGPDRVAGITMPSRITSNATLTDAERLAKNLGIEFHTVPIDEIHGTFLSKLLPFWEGMPPDITEENLQARIRGNIIMALSNKFGWLVLTTGNKSELATGYCTLYGDMVGGFSLIKDVPKTLVYSLAAWRNQQSDTPVIPPSTLERPPSAELRPDQRDTDSLPPYDMLDAIIERYVERDEGVDGIAAEGFDPAIVNQVSRLIDLSEYKRRQGAPGIKITPKAFGRDRRMPITNAYRERVKGTEPS